MDSHRKQKQLQSSLEQVIKNIPRGVHLTAAEVYRRAREEGLEVSLSTVYRTLHHLSSHGQVRPLAGEHGRRYESHDADHDHDHLICVKCGLTIEFEDDLLRGFGRTVADRKGYEYRSSRFDILGLCKTCKTKGEDHKIESAVTTIDLVLETVNQLSADLQEASLLFQSRKLQRGREILEDALDALHEAGEELSGTIDLLKEPADTDLAGRE